MGTVIQRERFTEEQIATYLESGTIRETNLQPDEKRFPAFE
jgi:hypothetical protein